MFRRWFELAKTDIILLLSQKLVNTVKRNLALFLNKRSPKRIMVMANFAGKYKDARSVSVC